MTPLPSFGLLDGKTAVVTGASRGIGRAIVETFRTHGARVLACARDPEAEAFQQWLEEQRSSPGGEVVAVRLDLADGTSITEAVKDIRTRAPGIDVLVNNAGIATGALFQMMSMADLHSVFAVNFFGPVALTQGLVRLMARNKAGAVVNISSTAAMIPDPGTLAYGASKAALARATQSMAAELGRVGIRVNAIAPGITRTDMLEQMDPKAAERLINASALKRPAEPQDIANAALFLASALSCHITGQIIRVDGGIV